MEITADGLHACRAARVRWVEGDPVDPLGMLHTRAEIPGQVQESFASLSAVTCCPMLRTICAVSAADR
jgi:hypothetical protein